MLFSGDGVNFWGRARKNGGWQGTAAGRLLSDARRTDACQGRGAASVHFYRRPAAGWDGWCRGPWRGGAPPGPPPHPPGAAGGPPPAGGGAPPRGGAGAGAGGGGGPPPWAPPAPGARRPGAAAGGGGAPPPSRTPQGWAKGQPPHPAPAHSIYLISHSRV